MMQSTADVGTPQEQTHTNLADIAIGSVIGRTAEFFDFFIFAIASVIVFPQYIFPFATRVDGTLFSFLVLALGFVVRPIGTIFFTMVGRRYGHGTKLTSALFLLGTSTVAISFLPSYAEQGWLTIASLCLVRMGQGVAVGGTWDGISSLLSINSPVGRKGMMAAIPQLGVPLGWIMASSLFIYLSVELTRAEFLDFGWRYPFFVAFAINVVALFARLRLVVSDEFQELYSESDLRPGPPFQTIREEWQNIIIGAFTPLATLALFHMVTVFPLAWFAIHNSLNLLNFMWLGMLGGLLGIVAILVSGVIADKIGRRKLLGYCAFAIAIYACILPSILHIGIVGATIYISVGFILLGLSFGQSSGATASGFALKNHYTSSNLTADLSWLVGAGFAPFVALFLAETYGLWSAGAYLLSGAIVTLITLQVLRRRIAAKTKR